MEMIVAYFLFAGIFVWFEVPREIITNQGFHFTSNIMQEITWKYHILHQNSNAHHQEVNGKVESMNKVLE